MEELVLLKGVASDIERSTRVSGSPNTLTTTHLTMFKIGNARVILETSLPAVISEGDEVILAGVDYNGQFQALACRNVTADWTSPLKPQGCAFAMLIFMAVLSFALFFLILTIFTGVLATVIALRIKKRDELMKRARQMVLET
jgi:hypothetical protein